MLYVETLKDKGWHHSLWNAQWEFDIFVFAETNINWWLNPEDQKLYSRTRCWWDSLHISYSHICNFLVNLITQYRGMVIFSLGHAAHRVMQKGMDYSRLGRWTWTQSQDRAGLALTVIAACCPNPPYGPTKAMHLFSIQDNRCPRHAFYHWHTFWYWPAEGTKGRAFYSLWMVILIWRKGI